MSDQNKNQLSVTAKNELAPLKANGHGLVLQTFDSMYRFAQCVVASKFAPKHYDTPEKVVIGLQWGMELGLSPMQSLKSIAVIGNSPSVWGSAIPALCRRHPQFESIKEEWAGEGETRKCTVTMKRKDDPEPTVRSFGYADAKRAGLLSRDTYKSYPDRMYQCRARGWAANDCFPDALMGLGVVEEEMDRTYKQLTNPVIESGDDAPADELDALVNSMGEDAAKALDPPDDVIEAAFDDNPAGPTAEEMNDPSYSSQLF